MEKTPVDSRFKNTFCDQNRNIKSENVVEVVDKTLIERLVLEHSDRLELEINQKARADAWKFYYRVRVDHIVRPFAVCKVCYRVLHCDSRSGTASLLRHPCNPLSERSPVNRAVKLRAKLNLPNDDMSTEAKQERAGMQNKFPNFELLNNINSLTDFRNSPLNALEGITSAAEHVNGSTSSPPASSPSLNLSLNNNIKQESIAPPNFPLDLRLLQLPQMMAAVSAHPLAALNLANVTALLSDPQNLHHFQQQRFEAMLRERGIQQERELKRHREETPCSETNGVTAEAGSSLHQSWGRAKIKKEKHDDSDTLKVSKDETFSHTEKFRKGHDPNNGRIPSEWMSKESVQQLIDIGSDRVELSDKHAGGSHYISDVWARFQVIHVDRILRPYATCKNCKKVVTYTKYSGTGSLLRHKCASQDSRYKNPSPKIVLSPPNSISPYFEQNLDISLNSNSEPLLNSSPIYSQNSSLNTFSTKSEQLDYNLRISPNNSKTIVTARALLKYMCEDLISPSAIDTPAFKKLLCTFMKIGCQNPSINPVDFLSSSQELLYSHVPSLVVNCRDQISKDIQDQQYLCFSMYCRREAGENIVTASLHSINENFELQNYAMGTKLYNKVPGLEVIHNLVGSFIPNYTWSSEHLRNKYLTIVTDEDEYFSESGATTVTCVWHMMETILKNLKEMPAYENFCTEICDILSALADLGMNYVSSQKFLSGECRWDGLLHALIFITSKSKEIENILSANQTSSSINPTNLSNLKVYEEMKNLLMGVQKCLMTVRDYKRPTLNQAVLFRAKLLQLCSSGSSAPVVEQIKSFLQTKIETCMILNPLHLVASFLDPRCKSLKVLSETEKSEVHRLVLEMMKSVSVTEANSGVLNLKTTRHSPACSDHSNGSPVRQRSPAPESHPFSEYMDNNVADLSVPDSEEIIAYANMKVHLNNDDILGWWGGTSSSGLPTLKRLVRKILAVPATCTFACQIDSHAADVSKKMDITDYSQINDILQIKYNTGSQF